jgi:hypothetical protein
MGIQIEPHGAEDDFTWADVRAGVDLALGDLPADWHVKVVCDGAAERLTFTVRRDGVKLLPLPMVPGVPEGLSIEEAHQAERRNPTYPFPVVVADYLRLVLKHNGL